jgi:hypothetical protein
MFNFTNTFRNDLALGLIRIVLFNLNLNLFWIIRFHAICILQFTDDLTFLAFSSLACYFYLSHLALNCLSPFAFRQTLLALGMLWRYHQCRIVWFHLNIFVLVGAWNGFLTYLLLDLIVLGIAASNREFNRGDLGQGVFLLSGHSQTRNACCLELLKRIIQKRLRFRLNKTILIRPRAKSLRNVLVKLNIFV